MYPILKKLLLDYSNSLEKEKDNAVLVWDIENINYYQLEEILEKLPNNPRKKFVVYRDSNLLSEVKIEFLKENGFKVLKSNGIADDQIINILNTSINRRDEFVLISNDKDFINIATRIINKGKNFFWFYDKEDLKNKLMQSSKKNISFIALTGNGFKYKKEKKKVYISDNKGLRIIKKKRESAL
jgi:uncharacterized LabA/DUF88 family protein